MASSSDSHVAVAGAGTPPSDSPGAGKKAGGAAVWNLPGSAAAPVVVEVGNPIMDADSWPALPGLASPSPPPAAKASPKAAPPPSTGAVMSPVSLGNPGALEANPDNEAPVRSPVARRVLVMPAGDALEKSAPSPEQSPVYVPNVRSNGNHHQNGRFNSHPHGRGGSYGGGNRRGNGGGGGRRGHDHHGGFDGQRRGGGRRDGHGPAHQQRGHQSTYIRAPPPLAVVAGAPPPPPPFVSPATPQTPPYGTPMGFPDIPQHVYYFPAPPTEGIQGLPFVHHPASPQAILIDPVRKELLEQIEYYFSDDNLCKDIFLRQHMDDQGWVSLSLIAGFRQVKKLTNNIQFILETIMLSTTVEVQGDKMRRRGTWENWLLPKYSSGTSDSTSPVTSSINSLASQFQSTRLEGAYYTNMHALPHEALLTRSTTSGSLDYPHNNGSGHFFVPKSAKSLLRSDTF
ncbi:hypothetical protein EJB05_07972 [Eragrostis curvula]|uniref:HTH La-type RNA-binding domain-containing protein n=1 Tax=Eragrostis curvula TaxID=38414 RepID=A0A5J9WJD3_9POAL|nr:hypothetical protein EJB05_07972 [Eragrostis curvula]